MKIIETMKKPKYFPLQIISILIFILLISATANAQVTLPGGIDDVDDETPAAPIGNLVWVGLIVGGYVGVKKIKK
ncbi:hypothetical protein [Haloflavibacter putidus]|nr:hypothetical protein [Haloflavibacter putidus]